MMQSCIVTECLGNVYVYIVLLTKCHYTYAGLEVDEWVGVLQCVAAQELDKKIQS